MQNRSESIGIEGEHPVEHRLPFEITVRPWDELSDNDRGFFCFQDDYLPLPPIHTTQIGLLIPADARRVSGWAFSSIPLRWPDFAEDRFKKESRLGVYNCWNDPIQRSQVRKWLFERGVPFRRPVYLLYEQHRVVQTTWKMVVKYWNAFAWSVGYSMLAIDHTLQWACCFHHEEVFIFGTNNETRTGNRMDLAEAE